MRTPSVISLFMIMVTLLCTVGAAPLPTASNILWRDDVLVNSQYNFRIRLDNLGDTGYGPVLDLVTPPHTTITRYKDSLGTTLSVWTHVSDGTCVDHPTIKTSDTTAARVCASAGATIHSIVIPRPSISSGEPAYFIHLSGNVDEATGHGTDLPLYSRLTFRFGETPGIEIGVDPPVFSSSSQDSWNWPVASARSVFARIVQVHENTNIPSPNNLHGQVVYLDVAPGVTLSEGTITVTPPPLAMYDSVTIAAPPTADPQDPSLLPVLVHEPTKGAISQSSEKTVAVRFTNVVGSASANDGRVAVKWYIGEEALKSSPKLEYVEDMSAKLDLRVTSFGSDTITTSLPYCSLDRATGCTASYTCDVSTLIASPKYPNICKLESRPLRTWVTGLEEAQIASGKSIPLDFVVYAAEYFHWNDIKIVATLPDGLRFDTRYTVNATLLMGDAGTSQVRETFVPHIPVTVDDSDIGNDEDPATSGKQAFTLDVSTAMKNAGITGGTITTPPFSGPNMYIRYWAQVLPQYSDTPPIPTYIRQGDKLWHQHSLQMTAVDRTTSQLLGNVEQTSYFPVVITMSLETIGSVYAINNVICGSACASTMLQAHDTVTFRLQYEMATSDYANFQISLFLPLPLLDTTVVQTPFPGTVMTSNTALPDVGHFILGPQDSVHSLDSGSTNVPTITVKGDERIVLTWPPYSSPENKKTLVDVLFTLKFSASPLPDEQQAGLIMEAQEGVPPQKGVTYLPFLLSRPLLTVRGGWVRSTNTDASISPAVPNGWVFTPTSPATQGACPAWTSKDLTSPPVSNVANLRDGDKIMGSIVVTNDGSGAAYNAVLREDHASGINPIAGTVCVNLASTGATVTHSGDLFSSQGLQLSERIDQKQSIIVTYWASVAAGISEMKTTSRLLNYTSTPDPLSPNYITTAAASRVTSHRTATIPLHAKYGTLSASSYTVVNGETYTIFYNLTGIQTSGVTLTGEIAFDGSAIGSWSGVSVSAPSVRFLNADKNEITDKSSVLSVDGNKVKFTIPDFEIISPAAEGDILFQADLKISQTTNDPIDIAALTKANGNTLADTEVSMTLSAASPKLTVSRVLKAASGTLTGAGVLETGRDGLIEYTIEHAGDSSADSVSIRLVDTLDRGIALAPSPAISGLTISSDGTTITYTTSTLALGSKIAFSVPVKATQTGSIVRRDSVLEYKASSAGSAWSPNENGQILVTIVRPVLDDIITSVNPLSQEVSSSPGQVVSVSSTFRHALSSTADAADVVWTVALPAPFAISANAVVVSPSTGAVVKVAPDQKSFTVTWMAFAMNAASTVVFDVKTKAVSPVGSYNYTQGVTYKSGADLEVYTMSGSHLLATVLEDSVPGPTIIGYRARDPDNGDVVYSDGDVVDIMFDSATTKPPISTMSEIDALFTFSHKPAIYYRGSWSEDGTMATIRFLDTLEHTSPPVIGTDTVETKIAIASATDANSTAKSTSPKLTGDWGRSSGPALEAFEALGNSKSGYQQGDRVVILYSEDTNTPDASGVVAISKFLVFSEDLGPVYAGEWENPRKLVITIGSPASTAPSIYTARVTSRVTVPPVLTNKAGTSSGASGSAVLTGDWGSDPVVCPVGPGGGTVSCPTTCPAPPTCPGDHPPAIMNATAGADNIWIHFDTQTNKPSLADKAAIDAMFTFTNPIGSDYSGAWVDDSTALLTITNQAGARPTRATDRVMGVTVKGQLTRADGTGGVSVSYHDVSNWNSRAGPSIIKIVGSDPDNLDYVFGSADVISLYFDQPTNRPAMNDAKAVDAHVQFNLPSGFGHTYSGAWSLSGDRLDITILTPSSNLDAVATEALRAATAIGTLKVTSVVGIQRADKHGMYPDLPSGPVAVSGDWGMSASVEIIALVAQNAPQSAFAPGSTLTIVFDKPVKRVPVLTPANIAALFVPQVINTNANGNNALLQMASERLPIGDYTGAWAGDGKQLVITVTDTGGVTPPVRGSLVVKVVGDVRADDDTSSPIALGTLSPPLSGSFYGTASNIGGNGLCDQQKDLTPACDTFVCKYWWLIVLALIFLVTGLVLLVCHSRRDRQPHQADKGVSRQGSFSDAVTPTATHINRQRLQRKSRGSHPQLGHTHGSEMDIIAPSPPRSDHVPRARTLIEQDIDLQRGLRSLSNLSTGSDGPKVKVLPPLKVAPVLAQQQGRPLPKSPLPTPAVSGNRLTLKPRDAPSTHLPPPPNRPRASHNVPTLNRKGAVLPSWALTDNKNAPQQAPPPVQKLSPLSGTGAGGSNPDVPSDDDEGTPLFGRNN